MPQIFYFMLKVILCSGILFGYYHLFLRNKVYHAYNRYYLLCAVVLSLTVPMITFDIYNTEEQTQLQPIQLLQAVNNSDAYIEEVITSSHTQNLELGDLLIVGYTAVGLTFLISFLLLLFRVYSLIRNSEKNVVNNIVLINTTAEGTPFSFFRYLFWNNEIDINTETGKHIFSHELAHIKEKHSLDKILLNVVLVICWINPFFWFIRKELNMIHEFMADKKAVGQYDTAVLASMIIQTAYPKHNFLITNHFFYSPIKRRLEMLSKYKSTHATYFTRILALPILFVLIAAFTFKAKEVLTTVNDQEFIVVVDAGHGGKDAGATAHDGSFEKDVNLALAKRVLASNTNEKIKIILTRASDVYQTPQEKTTFAQKMNADLFVSIHVSIDPSISKMKSGMEVYVPGGDLSNSATSKVFASALINTFASNYDLKVAPNPIERPTGIWVLKASKCPAVLIEAGYVSNKKDKAYLTSAEGMKTFADNLLGAINKYVNEVENLSIENLQPTKMEAQTGNILMKDYRNDTLPKNNSSTEITVIDDAEFIIQNMDVNAKSQHSIVVIGEKIYDVKDLNNKIVIGKRAKLYGKDNKMIIEKYGKRARDGAIIFEAGAIKDLPTGKYDVVIDQANQSVLTDASERINTKILDLNDNNIQINELKKTLQTSTIRLNGGLDSFNQPLYLLDGKKILLPTLQGLDPNLIKSIDVLKGASAQLKYGADAKNGAILIATKKLKELDVEGKKLELTKLNGSVEEVIIDENKLSPTVKQAKPEITLSGITTTRIPINRLKDITSVQTNMPGYKVISASIYFVGAGFSNVITTSFYGESLQNIVFFKRVQAGTSITFDNVVVEDAKGNRSKIAGKGFLFVPAEDSSTQP